MMKKLKTVACIIMAFAMTLSVTACQQERENIDTAKTQLYVGNFDGGFGSKWIENLKNRFEEQYKDYCFEPGVKVNGVEKKGVQVFVDNNKANYVTDTLTSTIKTSDQEVFFVSGSCFYEFTNKNLLLDISDIVTENLSEKYGENNTIENKIPDGVKAMMKRDGKYYAVPNFDGALGAVYDKDLFHIKKLYFAKNGAPSEKLQTGGSFSSYIYVGNNVPRSAGPDGKYDTYDDGLPATYEEFFELCDYMKSINITPFSWTGMYSNNYSVFLLKYLWADYEGKAQADLQFNGGSVEGKNTTRLMKFEDGKPVYDAEGNPVLESEDTVITSDNYSELVRQPGRYYSLKFWEKIISEQYYTPLSINISQTHVMAQADYIESRFKGKPIAMLLEGPWWENEADVGGSVDDIASIYGDEARPENRNFGFLPLPKATTAEIGKKSTIIKEISSAFINGNIKEEKKLAAKMFLQFAYTDESLNQKTADTGMNAGVKFKMTDETLEKLSPFTRDSLKFDENSDSVYNVYPTIEQYNAIKEYESPISYAYATINGQYKNTFFNCMLFDKVSAKDFYQGFYDYIKAMN